MKSPIFARVGKVATVAVLLVAGTSILAACSSDKANYRPAPNYTKPTATQNPPVYTPPSYAQPTAPQYANPTPPPTKPAGVACGKGKCG